MTSPKLGEDADIETINRDITQKNPIRLSLQANSVRTRNYILLNVLIRRKLQRFTTDSLRNLFRRFQAAFGLVGVGFVAGGFLAAHIVALPAFLHGVFFARLEALVEV